MIRVLRGSIKSKGDEDAAVMVVVLGRNVNHVSQYRANDNPKWSPLYLRQTAVFIPCKLEASKEGHQVGVIDGRDGQVRRVGR